MTKRDYLLRSLSVFAVFSMLGMLPAKARAESPIPPLDRVMDQVVIPGKEFKNANGLSIAKLRLMAFSKGNLIAVPFQIDEKLPNGDYIMSRRDGVIDRDVDNGQFDDNDELVFMAKDAGERGDPGKAGLSVSAGDEIELRDPLTGDRGWVYLAAFAKDAPELSPIVYMRYLEKSDHDEVITPYYTLHFPKNNVFINDIMIHESAGGNGKDFMDRIKMRSGVDVLGGMITVNRTEDDFVTEVRGVVKGPVRIIRQTGTRLVLLLSLKSPSVVVNGSFYSCGLEFPSVLSLPFRMDLVARDAYIRQGWDLNRQALGTKFYSNLNPEGVTMDGKMSPEELSLAHNRNTLHWALLSGPEGTFVFYGVWDKSAPIKVLLYYEDDLAHLEPPEEDPGVMGFAYRLEDLLKMGGKMYPFNIVNYVVPDYKGDVERALRVLKHPLEVKVNP